MYKTFTNLYVHSVCFFNYVKIIFKLSNRHDIPHEGPRGGVKNLGNIYKICTNKIYINYCMMSGYNDILLGICYRNIIIHHYNNITDREGSKGRASDPTTKLFILDNIQKLPFKWPRVGMLRA